MYRLVSLAVAAAAALLSEPASAQAARIPVLVLTGESGTDWRWSSTWMHALLESSGRFDVEIATYPGATLADRYDASRFQVFVIDYEGVRWGDVAEANFLELVSSGKGVVAVGGASRAFPDWEAYHTVLGCKWDDAGGADPFGPVAIRGTDQHELVEGFGAWTDHSDVLLLGMKPAGTHKVLGVVDRPDPAGGPPTEVPVVIAGKHGEGRVVTSTLGHVSFGDPRTQASLLDPQYQQFLVRACEWAATGKTSTIARIEPNTLTETDRAAGWLLLFGGDKDRGWAEYRGAGMPADRWTVQNGVLFARSVQGDKLLQAQPFEEFEVELEWKVASEAKSEILVVPDAGVVDEGVAVDKSGQSLRILRPAGEFNQARVVATRNGVEQWLNGIRIATYRMSPGEWADRMTGERAKDDPELARNMPLLRVVRDNEGTAVWFRNLRIRRLDTAVMPPPTGAAPRDAFVELFNGQNLEGWTWVPWTPNGSPGPFVVEEGLLVCKAAEIGYLRTDATYGDFELELEWRANPTTRQGGPSGVMIRMQPSEARTEQAQDGEIFWPRSVDVRLGANEAGDVHAVRNLPMQVERRRFNGLIARRMRNMEHRLGEWNHAYVRLERGELVVRMNGEVVNVASAVGGDPGSIGIRSEGTEVQLRNIRLRPLSD